MGFRHMPKVHQRWTILPHGPVEQLEEGLLTVQGQVQMPLGSFPRRMTIVRLSSGGTVIFNGVALSEPEMKQVEALGPPKFLVVPSPYHRIDSLIFKQRYPKLRLLTPPGAEQRVRDAVTVDATTDILQDPEVRFLAVAGTKRQESALIVSRPNGTTLIVNDVIGNVRNPKGLAARLVAQLVGYYGAPSVPRTVRFAQAEPLALADQFRTWAQLPRLKRIIVSHGEVISDRPAEVLNRLAAKLSGRSDHRSA